MAAAGHAGEDANLFDTVKAVGDELCREIGVAIPVGKDSMSMRARWQSDDTEYQVVAPVSLIVSAFAPVDDVTRHLTPQLQATDEPSSLLLLDLGEDRNRLGGSSLLQSYARQGGAEPDVDSGALLARFFAAVQALNERNLVLAYHDRSDGGLFACVAEMMFAGRRGVDLSLAGSDEEMLQQLFSEELGAVLQVAQSKLAQVQALLDQHGIEARAIGSVVDDPVLTVHNGDSVVLQLARATAEREVVRNELSPASAA